jgi:hypothetical protein
MGGFSLWHWLIVLLVLGGPFVLIYLVYLAIRAGVRDGMKDRDKGSGPSDSA